LGFVVIVTIKNGVIDHLLLLVKRDQDEFRTLLAGFRINKRRRVRPVVLPHIVLHEVLGKPIVGVHHVALIKVCAVVALLLLADAFNNEAFQ
jgi:hypothetical protein